MNNEEKILSMLETLVVEQQKTNQRLDNLERDMQSVKSATLRIENEHGSKLGALFDSYSLLYDISSEIRENIGLMQGVQEKHDLHIKWLDSQQKAK